MTSDLKECIREKKHAFKNGNTELRKKRCELRAKLSKAKIEYKDKVEVSQEMPRKRGKV